MDHRCRVGWDVQATDQTIMRDLILQQWTAGRSKHTVPPGAYDVRGELGEVVCVVKDASVVLHIVQLHNEALALAKDGPESRSNGGMS